MCENERERKESIGVDFEREQIDEGESALWGARKTALFPGLMASIKIK